jgi:hypothetical protein
MIWYDIICYGSANSTTSMIMLVMLLWWFSIIGSSNLVGR